MAALRACLPVIIITAFRFHHVVNESAEFITSYWTDIFQCHTVTLSQPACSRTRHSLLADTSNCKYSKPCYQADMSVVLRWRRLHQAMALAAAACELHSRDSSNSSENLHQRFNHSALSHTRHSHSQNTTVSGERRRRRGGRLLAR